MKFPMSYMKSEVPNFVSSVVKKGLVMLMVKRNEKEFLAFITPSGDIELRDANFNPCNFEQEDGEVLMKDMRTFSWSTIPVSNFKNLLTLRSNQCIQGLASLVS